MVLGPREQSSIDGCGPHRWSWENKGRAVLCSHSGAGLVVVSIFTEEPIHSSHSTAIFANL